MARSPRMSFFAYVIMFIAAYVLPIIVLQLISMQHYGARWDALLILEVPYLVIFGVNLVVGLRIGYLRYYAVDRPAGSQEKHVSKNLGSMMIRMSALFGGAFGLLMYAVIYLWHRPQMEIGIPLMILGLACALAMIPTPRALIEKFLPDIENFSDRWEKH